MIPYERHEAIMNLLREKKYVRTEQLSKALYVSVATIRRDLTEMVFIACPPCRRAEYPLCKPRRSRRRLWSGQLFRRFLP